MIGLMDCNNFFVSCERLFRPDLLKTPVAVLSSNDGCIVARSQEIKDLGIPMGVPYFKVKNELSKAHAVLFSSNFTLYRDISMRIMQTLAAEVGPCEIYSIDEAFFFVPDDCTQEEILALRALIMKKVGLPVSIGVAETKTLAKLASSMAKKGNGVCILEIDVKTQIQELPCTSVWGLGRQTSAKLREMGVVAIGEFLKLDRSVIQKHFGVAGERIQLELNGTVVHTLGANSADVNLSIMSSRSFSKTTRKLSDVESAVAYHVSAVAQKLREKSLLASRMHLSILASRHGDFLLRKGSAEITFVLPTNQTKQLLHEVLAHVRLLFDPEVPYKKVGVVAGGLMPESYMTEDLFDTQRSSSENASLDKVVDSLNDRFGHGMVRSGAINAGGPRASAKLRSQEYTTSWKDIPNVGAN